MKIRNDWGMTFMAKFNTGGAVKDSEREEKQTSATRTSSRPVESANKSFKTAPRCSLQRVAQETLDWILSEKSDKQSQEEELDVENTDVYSLGAEIDVTKIIHSMKRGKRSAQRGSSEPWLQQLEALQSRNVARRVRHKDRGLGSKKMKRTRRATKSLRVNNRVANKGKKDVGGEGEDACNQSMGRAAQTNAIEHLSRPNSETSSASVSSEVKVSNDPSEISLEQAAILMNNTFLGFTKSKGAVADDLMDTTDVISLYQDREKCTKFDPAIIPGLDLNDEAEKFDTSTAESALASLCSLCAVSVPDSCVEFAVKILKDENTTASRSFTS